MTTKQAEFKYESRFNTQGLTRFSCGLFAGLISRTAVAPFERVIIMMQTRQGSYKDLSTFGFISKIYKKEGTRGLFRGNMANIFRVAPFTAFEFTLFDIIKYQINFVPCFKDLPNHLKLFASGCMAGCASYALVYPIDVVKTMHSLGLHTDKGVVDTLAHLLHENGIRKCYRGLLATCFGITPYAGIKLTTYQLLVNKFRVEGDQSNLQNLAFGAIAGCVAVSFCYPTDTIRRNYQVSILKDEPTGYLKIFKSLYRRNGLLGFYSGLVPTYCKVLPSVALAFCINDFLKSKFIEK